MKNNVYVSFFFKKILPHLNKVSKKIITSNKHKIKSKSSKKFNPVTKYDIYLEKKIRSEIQKNFPNHNVHGEEIKPINNNSDHTWMIDPIDGTKALIIGMPTWSNLLGLEINKKPFVGFANFPMLKKCYYNISGKSYVVRQGKKVKISTSKKKSLKNSILVTNTLHTIKNIKLLNFFKKYKNFFKINSADAYNYCLLSEGKVDVVIEAGLKPFDIEPLVPIIKNAGGIVSNWHGGDDISKGSVVVSCNKVIHSKILNLLRKFI